MSQSDDEIKRLEAAQDSRAQALGYALIRAWVTLIEPTTRFVTATSSPSAAALFSDKAVWHLLGEIRHEVGRHARIYAYHQTKIDALREEHATATAAPTATAEGFRAAAPE